MLGFGPHAPCRVSSNPITLDAASEMTIELVDTPVVLESERKSDALTRFGRADALGKNRGSGFHTEALLVAAAHAEETDLPAAQNYSGFKRKDPAAFQVLGSFSHLTGLSTRLPKRGFIDSQKKRIPGRLSVPVVQIGSSIVLMAERDGALYLLTSNELLVSIDSGKTWNSLGATSRRTVQRALIITDTAIYLALQTEVFRSEDVGNQWEPIGEALQADNAPEADNPNFRNLGRTRH